MEGSGHGAAPTLPYAIPVYSKWDGGRRDGSVRDRKLTLHGLRTVPVGVAQSNQ